MPGCYLNKKYIKYIDKTKIEVIFEIGSRDCLDAINLHKYYGVKVYAFECNPLANEICKKNLKEQNITIDQVELIEKAIYNKNEEITFYPVDKTIDAEKYKSNPDFVSIDDTTSANIGASSIFKINEEYQKLKYKNKNYHQQNKEIKVNAIRLDSFMNERNIEKIDMICMDLQGSELMALQSLGNNISNINYIITELCTSVKKNGKIIENYEGQGDINKVFKLLFKNGFKHILGNINRFSHDDFLFINIK